MSNRSITAVTIDLQDDNQKHHYSTPCRTEDDFPEAFELEKVSNLNGNNDHESNDHHHLLNNNYIAIMNKLEMTTDKDLDDEDVNVDLYTPVQSDRRL